VIEMRVRDGYRLEREAMPFEGLDNPFSLISRIDADCQSGGFTTDNARVLLESGDRDFFDDHLFGLPGFPAGVALLTR
jgi:hypothetical protein